MTARENMVLSRSTYSLKDVANLAGLDVDDMLEKHVREGDLDLYIRVPAGYSVYSLIRDYLEMKPPSVVRYPHLVRPKKHAEIEAVQLSRKDCVALARFRKVELRCFPAGLAAKSDEAVSVVGQDEFDSVLLRDWNFYPGQYEALDFQFGHGERLSEQSLDAIRKGVTFRLNSEHVEGGGPSDFSLMGRTGGRLQQSYAYWFGVYPDPPAPGPVVDKHTGISPPETMFISEADVFVIRADVRSFLERSGRLAGNHTTQKSAFTVPDEFPQSCASYSIPDVLKKSKSGDIRAVPRQDSPIMLKVLFDARESRWAKDWKKNVGLGSEELDVINRAVIVLMMAFANEQGLKLSESDAREIAYFVRPVWARREEDPQVKSDWSVTYETPEFMRLVSAASRLQAERPDRSSCHVNKEIDAILKTADPVSISGNKLRLARMVVRYAPGKPGKPSGLLSAGKPK